jgi:signal transduction histidine kinase
MNSILGFSDVLSGADNLSDSQKRYLKNIQSSGKDLLLLINDLLDLAKIESGKMEITPTDLSLKELVSQQVNSLEPLAQKKNIEVSYEIPEELDSAYQDRGKLQQILNNFLSNAIKFTPEGGRVRVSIQAADKTNRLLIVEDTGIGIPLEDQEAIFEKFRQGKALPGQANTMTRDYGGTGLGLSIVKELAKLLGGEVFLESEFGKGSTFSVRFPVHLDKELLHLDQQMQERLLGLEDMELASENGSVSASDGEAVQNRTPAEIGKAGEPAESAEVDTTSDNVQTSSQ